MLGWDHRDWLPGDINAALLALSCNVGEVPHDLQNMTSLIPTLVWTVCTKQTTWPCTDAGLVCTELFMNHTNKLHDLVEASDIARLIDQTDTLYKSTITDALYNNATGAGETQSGACKARSTAQSYIPG